MTATSEPRLKITYATLRNDNEQLHASFDAGLAMARGELGATHGIYIDGQWRPTKAMFEKRSPIDGSLVGQFASGTRADVRDAIAAARAAAPGWARTPWLERVAVMRRMADIISERQMELAALMGIEVGKNRLEALGDVEETADLIRYYCDQFVANDGFDHAMGNLGDATVHTRSVLKPHGVWAVISPFNFPMALSGGPSGGALVAGNTVVYKPSSDSPLCGVKLAEMADLAGLPRGVFNMVSGPGATVGAELQENEGVDGLLFTGSYEIGFDEVFKKFSKRFPKPVVVEMGGKNPAIVSARADLEEAAEGVMRSAFGYGGQKCSACSRVYVQAPVYDAFVEALVAKTRGIAVGDPTDRKVWLGPLVNAAARAKYDAAVADAKRDGRIVVGGEALAGHGSDLYVAPTVVADLPADHRIWHEELFVPLVAVGRVESLDEAFERANDTIYGLTAGFFSDDREEIEAFKEAIEAGVIYINRRAGATTGAWPGIQPFGGWKGSGTTGKAGGGMYYVQQFMREQSQTLVD
ncbi:MAG: aldehyde dehydrogenase family protein [Candidatus Limnocylindrales bacterium]